MPPPNEIALNRNGNRKRSGGLRVYASIAAAGALLFSCFALFQGIYSIIGLLWPWLSLGVPEALLRQFIRACIALPIALAVLVFHFRILRQQSF